MTQFLWTVREWLRWRARQGRTHIPGIAEHTSIGTIVARDNQQWSIEDDQGRLVYVPLEQLTAATNLQVGDRVEIQPIPFGGPVLRPFNWTIIRKLERHQG